MSRDKGDKNVKQANRMNQIVSGTRCVWMVKVAALLAAVAGSTVSLSQPLPDGLPAMPVQPPQPEAPAQGAVPEPVMRDPMNPPVDPNKEEKEPVRVGSDSLVELHAIDEDLNVILSILAKQSGRNILPSKEVGGRVTADLSGVTFYEALDAILLVNGFGYIEQGNFIFVYPIEKIKEIQESQRKRVSRVFHLNYLNAEDALTFVTPLVSEGGKVTANKKTASYPSGSGSAPVGADEYALEATMVVFDFQENVDAIERLFKEIDVKPVQVLVEATILQADLTESNAFGVDFALLADLSFNDFVRIGGPSRVPDALYVNARDELDGSGTVAADNNGTGGAIASTPGNFSGPATFKAGVLFNNVGVFVRLLDEVTNSVVLSNPKVLALNRMPARVLVGQRVGYLNTTSTDTTTTQSVQFLDTGTQLNFRPFVSGRDIRMELKPQVSTAVIREQRTSSNSTVTIPDEITNEMTTNVTVKDGNTIVLGGLFKDSTVSSRRQIPILGDIPLIGAAFRGSNDTVTRNEIIFLITPSLVSDSTLAAQGEMSEQYIERCRTGAREGLLFFSRDKITSQKLVEAQRLAAQGDNKMALWKVEQSLAMNHHQPDAIELRDRLTNTKKVWPHRSLLENIMQAQGARGESQPPLAEPPSPAMPKLQPAPVTPTEPVMPPPPPPPPADMPPVLGEPPAPPPEPERPTAQAPKGAESTAVFKVGDQGRLIPVTKTSAQADEKSVPTTGLDEFVDVGSSIFKALADGAGKQPKGEEPEAAPSK